MKRLAAAALFAASTLVLSAQTSVWKVTRGESTLYLGGTCHVLRPGDFPLPPEFGAAFAAAQTLFFETDLARVLSPEMQRVLMTRGLLANGQTLEKVLSPDAWSAVSAYLAKNKLPPEKFAQVKPWLFAVMMAAIELQKLGVTQEGVDVQLFRDALKAGKSVGQLEPFERHVEFIVTMADGHESELLLNGLQDLETTATEFPRLISAWRAGDLKEIDRLMIQDMREKYPAIHRSLLVQRNADWLPEIERLLGTPETEFVLAGVAHFAGPEGLIAQLRARGCTVEQAVAPAAGND